LIIIGIFVGGESRRMGGRPKGLLRTADGETVLARTIRLARGVSSRVVLVGRCEAYDVALPTLTDPSGDSGPLGGLQSLLLHAEGAPVMALACDMPLFSSDLLDRLGRHPDTAPVVAPRRAGRWEPLFARYTGVALPVVTARIARRALALQGLLDELGVSELPLLPGEETLLTDWDRPEDCA
jgi:molybdenum cofactor guanylyltransferase